MAWTGIDLTTMEDYPGITVGEREPVNERLEFVSTMERLLVKNPSSRGHNPIDAECLKTQIKSYLMLFHRSGNTPSMHCQIFERLFRFIYSVSPYIFLLYDSTDCQYLKRECRIIINIIINNEVEYVRFRPMARTLGLLVLRLEAACNKKPAVPTPVVDPIPVVDTQSDEEKMFAALGENTFQVVRVPEAGSTTVNLPLLLPTIVDPIHQAVDHNSPTIIPVQHLVQPIVSPTVESTARKTVNRLLPQYNRRRGDNTPTGSTARFATPNFSQSIRPPTAIIESSTNISDNISGLRVDGSFLRVRDVPLIPALAKRMRVVE